MKDGTIPWMLLLDGVEKGILVLLIIMGVVSLWFFVSRYRALSRAKGNPEEWEVWLAESWDEKTGLILPEGKNNAPSRLARTAMANFKLAPEALEKTLEAQTLSEKRELEKGTPFLATVGSNAPFLGLTGTVIGILMAFQGLAESGGQGGTEVMEAISRALVATAVGLLVAIPAVVFYNILRTRIRNIQDRNKELSALFLARSLEAALRKEA